jgi:hypothetical protein
VDIRTFARRNQLAHDQLLDTEASDEHYYRTLSASNSFAVAEDESANTFAQTLPGGLPRRRGLIGKKIVEPCEEDSQGEQDGLQRASISRHQKAYSIAVPGEKQSEQDRLGLGFPVNGSASVSKAPFASPRIPSHRVPVDGRVRSAASSRFPSSSSSNRKPSGPIAASHPHSRKKSVAQFQAEDLSATFEVDNGIVSLSDEASVQDADDSSTTTPRASLEKRDRSTSGFYSVGDNSTMESVLREDITKLSQSDGRTLQQNGMGHHGHASGSETILWTFAQFEGHFQVDESLVKPGEFEQVKERLSSIASPFSAAGGSSLAAFGAGEFGNSVEGEGEDRQSKRSWGSFLRSAISYGGGSKGMSAGTGNHRRSESTLLSHREKMMSSRTVPILSNPPTMIAVDVTLAPGESRSFTLRVPLPPDLPPSYIGKAITFQYLLTLGTNRLAPNRNGGVEQKSRLVRIPMRIYNHVNITGVTAFYDLTNPIVNLIDDAIVIDEQETTGTSRAATGLKNRDGMQRRNSTARKRRSSSKAEAAAEASFLQYTRDLLQSCSDTNDMDAAHSQDAERIDADLAELMARKSRIQDLVKTSPNAMRAHLMLPPTSAELHARKGRRRSDASQAGLGLVNVDDEDVPKSNSQAVEILSRNSQKVSYDISKDGQIAATLTLIKSKYRLGDVVMGVVTINAADCIAKVVRVAATLESHEEIEATLATLPPGRVQKLTRIVHASCHDSTLDAGQAHFSLPIPSGATPNFETSAVRLNWTIRLAFLTQSCVRDVDAPQRARPAPHLVAAPDDGFSAYHRAFRAVPSLAGPCWDDRRTDGADAEVKLEVVECAVPLNVLPHSTRFNAGEVAFVA